MATLLHIDSSSQNESSVSRRLSRHFAEQWQKNNQGSTVIYRDLTAGGINFITNDHILAFNAHNDSLSPTQLQLRETSDALVRELQEADTYVIGVPMYNFGLPAVFKAYIDLVVRAGVTFKYASGGGFEGLLQNKKVFIVTASGADLSQAHMKGYDFVEPYLRAILGFIGITDITFIKSFGVHPEAIAKNSEAAKAEIDRIFDAVGTAV